VWRKVGAGVDKGAVFLWTLGDFNGDGKLDVLWRNQGPGGDIGKLYIWMMDGPNVIGGTGYTAAQADLGWSVDSPKR